MTMHLEGPWLSMNGKQRGRKKWASADAKRQAEELAREWEAKQKVWKSMSKIKSARPLTAPLPKLAPPPGRETTRYIPSLDTGVTGAVNIRAIPKYTGDKIIGIGTLHKSNAVPIFTNNEAKDIAHMRR